VLPEQQEFLGDILTSSRHLLQLINDVLDLSKVEAGKMEFHPERVDLAKLVTEIRDILRSLAASKRTKVTVDVAPGIGEVVVDAVKLKQVLYNYLSVCRSDGESGLEAAEKEGPAAIVVDLVMPGMGGFEFLERLKRQPWSRGIPVIVWTEKDISAGERLRLAAAAESVVLKREGPGSLVEELRQYVPPAGLSRGHS